MNRLGKGTLTALALAAAGIVVQGSSHREGPNITKYPKLDGTDFYMFRSYEANRGNYVTLLANYYPLQDPSGGPNFFMLDEDAVYEIHVDNNGDAREDLTFQFQFQSTRKNITVPVDGSPVAIPLINVGPIGPGRGDTANLNVEETYTLSLIRGARRTGQREAVTAASGGSTFRKPVDRIGDKSIPAYGQYADNHIYDVNIPGCAAGGRVFVGQRREGFVINIGEVFDLINTNPVGPEDAETNDLAAKNVTTLALEVPIDCLVSSGPVIGAWTTSSMGRGTPAAGSGVRSAAAQIAPGQFTQVSRLANPLVNEVVIGLKDKDGFNASEPSGDSQFLDYVTHPTLPVLIQVLFGLTPPATPRADLVQVFLTGVAGLNQPAGVTPSEMMRLNTAIAAVPAASQNRLGVIAGDNAGYPNGRRPGDDVIDISLRVVEGILTNSSVPALTDGAISSATIAYDPAGNVTGDQNFRLFRDSFPYLTTPLSSSPRPIHQQ